MGSKYELTIDTNYTKEKHQLFRVDAFLRKSNNV